MFTLCSERDYYTNLLLLLGSVYILVIEPPYHKQCHNNVLGGRLIVQQRVKYEGKGEMIEGRIRRNQEGKKYKRREKGRKQDNKIRREKREKKSRRKAKKKQKKKGNIKRRKERENKE